MIPLFLLCHRRKNHVSRNPVDGRLPRLLFQTFSGHPAHTFSASQIQTSFVFKPGLIFFFQKLCLICTNGRKNQRSVGHIRIIPAVFTDCTAHRSCRPLDLFHFQIQNQPRRRFQADCFQFFFAQQHPCRRFCSRCTAASGGIPSAQLFLIFPDCSEILLFHPDLTPPVSASSKFLFLLVSYFLFRLWILTSVSFPVASLKFRCFFQMLIEHPANTLTFS